MKLTKGKTYTSPSSDLAFKILKIEWVDKFHFDLLINYSYKLSGRDMGCEVIRVDIRNLDWHEYN